MSYSTVIAIDGPSGSGKSTVAKTLAQELDILYIDTGAMFRALAYSADKKGVPFESGAQMKDFLQNINVEYLPESECLIRVDGEDLTKKIREHQVSKLASIISQIPEVRSFLLDFQRKLAESKVCVMEGRDIGTVVFPNAFCKFFITASIEVRAQRRFDQLKEAGKDVDIDQLIKDVEKRDQKDSDRDVAPLKVAEDAELVDTSSMPLNSVIGHIKKEVSQRASGLGIGL